MANGYIKIACDLAETNQDKNKKRNLLSKVRLTKPNTYEYIVYNSNSVWMYILHFMWWFAEKKQQNCVKMYVHEIMIVETRFKFGAKTKNKKYNMRR